MEGSREDKKVGVQPHCKGETRIVTDNVYDVLHAGSLHPEVVFPPPPIKDSSQDAAPITTGSKMPEFTYYDQIWVYSALEAHKSDISKDNFAVISNLQRLDRLDALEKLVPIRLSLDNQILTSEEDNTTDSNDSESDSPHTPKGDKLKKYFLPRDVSSKADMADVVNSINRLGEIVVDFDAVVDQVADNVKNHTKAMIESITSLQESHTELNQRLDTLEATQASIMENQYVIMDLLCEIASENGISTDDVPKGEKK